VWRAPSAQIARSSNGVPAVSTSGLGLSATFGVIKVPQGERGVAGVAGFHVSLEFHAGDVRTCPILLSLKRAFMDAVVKLSATDAQDPRGLGYFETQTR
jgi:hypothetical protein